MATETSASQYWAAQQDPAKVAQEAWRWIERWFQHVGQSKLPLWRLALAEYYAGANEGGTLGTAGEAGEHVTIKMPEVHSLGEQIVSAITAQPPAFTPKARNNDAKSQKQTMIAAGLLETAMREKGLDDLDTNATRVAYMAEESFATSLWDKDLGQDYATDPDTGRMVKTGDVRFRWYHPLDVVRDYCKERSADHVWWMPRDYMNKWDLIARIPEFVQGNPALAGKEQELEQKIRALPSKIEAQANQPRLETMAKGQNEDTDDVPVFRLYHRPTPALPRGREFWILSADLWLVDKGYEYEGDVVHRMAAEDRIGSERGNTPLYDLLAPQHVYNAAQSSNLTAVSTFGGAAVAVAQGSNLSDEQLTSGPVVLHYTGDKPPIAMSLVDPRYIDMNDRVKADALRSMERYSGVNAISRGDPEALIKGASGAALALVDAKTLERVKPLMKARFNFLSSIATATIGLYRKFATVPQTMLFTGKSKKAAVLEFVGDDVAGVERVVVEPSNPFANTAAGRQSMLDYLLKLVDANGNPVAVKTPEHIVEVLTYGRLEPAIEGEQAELLSIREENEQLAEGAQLRASLVDDHAAHVKEHRTIVASPAVRNAAPGSPEEQIQVNALTHILEHTTLAQDPANLPLFQMLGYQWAAALVPPPMPMGPPGAAPVPPGEESGAPPDGMPSLPSMPTNPATGEQAPSPALPV